MVKQCFGRRICPLSSSAPRTVGAAYVPILLSEVEQEQRPTGNGDREAIVVGTGLCDSEGERAYTVYDCILDGGKVPKIFFEPKILIRPNSTRIRLKYVRLTSTLFIRRYSSTLFIRRVKIRLYCCKPYCLNSILLFV